MKHEECVVADHRPRAWAIGLFDPLKSLHGHWAILGHLRPNLIIGGNGP